VPLETAIALLKDMGGSSIKYFPMGGLKHRDEFVAVAQPAPAMISGWSRPAASIWKTTAKFCRSRWTRGQQNYSAHL
jgi:hypothetical protein